MVNKLKGKEKKAFLAAFAEENRKKEFEFLKTASNYDLSLRYGNLDERRAKQKLRDQIQGRIKF